ncbi:MAG: hypothetical protein CMH61_02820 [Nanoarchaeota archaeon]|nr:hypothetical protein [Nanoarchaeota archaeon]|tara:strand:+ start:420 stop:992 length:573 start_codon:yes stop_codon:yes gene_type:complete
MKKDIKIAFDKNKCTGAGKCAAVYNDRFRLQRGKARIKGVSPQDGVFSVSIKANDAELEKAILSSRVCPSGAIAVTDENKKKLVKKRSAVNAKIVNAKYDDNTEFKIDRKGYFLIRVNERTSRIEVAFCNKDHEITLKVIGKKPIDIYHTILNKEKVPIRKDHAAYLGRELQKAYFALSKGLNYIQDEEL